MNRTYHCLNCGKHFYVFGKAATALGQLTLATQALHSEGYNLEHTTTSSTVIQKIAKCCYDPCIFLKSLGD